jgi:hypothetical protein
MSLLILSNGLATSGSLVVDGKAVFSTLIDPKRRSLYQPWCEVEAMQPRGMHQWSC